jgi:hypothetical protein
LGEMTLDILIGGGLDSWMLWDPMIDKFRNTLMRFVGRIVQELLGEAYPEIDRWRIHFQGTKSKLLISACLDSGEWGTDSKVSVRRYRGVRLICS